MLIAELNNYPDSFIGDDVLSRQTSHHLYLHRRISVSGHYMRVTICAT